MRTSAASSRTRGMAHVPFPPDGRATGRAGGGGGASPRKPASCGLGPAWDPVPGVSGRGDRAGAHSRHRGEWKSGTFAKTPFPPDGWYVDYSWVDWAGDDRCTTCSLPPRALRHPSRAVPLVPTTRWSAHIKRTELKKMMGPSGRCPALSRSTPGWGRT